MDTRASQADLAAFGERLRGPLRYRLDGAAPVVAARAPGRLDAVGGVIDYTGGTVCEMPLGEATRVALQPRRDRKLVLHSVGIDDHGLAPEVVVDLDRLVPSEGPREYAAVRAELNLDPAQAWAGYVVGAWLVLAREGLVASYEHGANVIVESDVPVGAGVSSSAALEMATLYALTAWLGLTVPGKRLARLGQMVENSVVGAPCGLMDQLTVGLGRQDALLVIRCQPDEILASQKLPAGVCLGAIHTGVKHAVSGRRYTDARVAAFMAHAVILHHLRTIREIEPGDDPFGGYLARIPLKAFERAYEPLLPETVMGSSFQRTYGGTVDRATRIDPDAVYRVAPAARHHVRDNHRTQDFLAALREHGTAKGGNSLRRAGECMLASHAGYRDDLGLGAPEADLLVELMMARGPEHGLYGARITGGGCGGSVIALGDSRLPALLPALAAEYAERSGERPAVLLGSSDGAEATGALELAL